MRATKREESIAQWYDPSAFITAANGTFGNSRRNSLRAPGIDTQNASLGKTFHLFEGAGLQFRADASNVFNHPNFDAPDGNFNDPVNLSTPNRPQGSGHDRRYYGWWPQHADQRAASSSSAREPMKTAVLPAVLYWQVFLRCTLNMHGLLTDKRADVAFYLRPLPSQSRASSKKRFCWLLVKSGCRGPCWCRSSYTSCSSR